MCGWGGKGKGSENQQQWQQQQDPYAQQQWQQQQQDPYAQQQQWPHTQYHGQSYAQQPHAHGQWQHPPQYHQDPRQQQWQHPHQCRQDPQGPSCSSAGCFEQEEQQPQKQQPQKQQPQKQQPQKQKPLETQNPPEKAFCPKKFVDFISGAYRYFNENESPPTSFQIDAHLLKAQADFKKQCEKGQRTCFEIVANCGNAKIDYESFSKTESSPFGLESLVEASFKFESELEHTLKLQSACHTLVGLNHESLRSRFAPELSSQKEELKAIRERSFQQAQHAKLLFKEYRGECFKVLLNNLIFYYAQRHGNGFDMSNEIKHYLTTLMIFRTVLRQDDIFSHEILRIDTDFKAMKCAKEVLEQGCLSSNCKIFDYPDVSLMYIPTQDPIQDPAIEQETAALRAAYEASVKKHVMRTQACEDSSEGDDD